MRRRLGLGSAIALAAMGGVGCNALAGNDVGHVVGPGSGGASAACLERAPTTGVGPFGGDDPVHYATSFVSEGSARIDRALQRDLELWVTGQLEGKLENAVTGLSFQGAGTHFIARGPAPQDGPPTLGDALALPGPSVPLMLGQKQVVITELESSTTIGQFPLDPLQPELALVTFDPTFTVTEAKLLALPQGVTMQRWFAGSADGIQGVITVQHGVKGDFTETLISRIDASGTVVNNASLTIDSKLQDVLDVAVDASGGVALAVELDASTYFNGLGKPDVKDPSLASVVVALQPSLGQGRVSVLHGVRAERVVAGDGGLLDGQLFVAGRVLTPGADLVIERTALRNCATTGSVVLARIDRASANDAVLGWATSLSGVSEIADLAHGAEGPVLLVHANGNLVVGELDLPVAGSALIRFDVEGRVTAVQTLPTDGLTALTLEPNLGHWLASGSFTGSLLAGATKLSAPASGADLLVSFK